MVQIDGMGTSNRSKKFHDLCWKNIGDAGFADRIPWIKAAAANGWLDETRVVDETLTAIRRAGADVVVTYFAGAVAARLNGRGQADAVARQIQRLTEKFLVGVMIGHSVER